MLSQLERIKSKDYAQLDDRLFNNITKTGQLDDTIIKLAQLQKYLKNQIDKIQDQQQKQAALQASKIVLADMNYPMKTQKCNCYEKMKQMKEQIVNLKRYLKKCGQYIAKQHALITLDIKEQAKDVCQDLITKYSRKCSQNIKLSLQIQNLQSKISELRNQTKKQNNVSIKNSDGSECKTDRELNNFLKTQHLQRQKLHQMNIHHTHSKSNLETRRLLDEQTNINNFFSGNFFQQSKSPKLPMPLRKPNSTDNYTRLINNNNNQHQLSNQTDSIKSMKRYNSFIQRKPSQTQLTILTSDFRYSRQVTPLKTNNQQNLGNRDKQNLMLKRKGIDVKQQRKSVKKLKVFSRF